jgi:hypothetical protein
MNWDKEYYEFCNLGTCLGLRIIDEMMRIWEMVGLQLNQPEQMF